LRAGGDDQDVVPQRAPGLVVDTQHDFLRLARDLPQLALDLGITMTGVP
jgi:hypothetical protein